MKDAAKTREQIAEEQKALAEAQKVPERGKQLEQILAGITNLRRDTLSVGHPTHNDHIVESYKFATTQYDCILPQEKSVDIVVTIGELNESETMRKDAIFFGEILVEYFSLNHKLHEAPRLKKHYLIGKTEIGWPREEKEMMNLMKTQKTTQAAIEEHIQYMNEALELARTSIQKPIEE